MKNKNFKYAIIAGVITVSVIVTVVSLRYIFKAGDNKFGLSLGAVNQKLIYPIKGTISSGFGTRIDPITGAAGQFHNGIDIYPPEPRIGTKIKSPADGVVILMDWNDDGGNQLRIKHDNGYITGYAHLSKYLVKLGDKVKQGQYIAEVGATGKVTGAHLNFTLVNTNTAAILDPTKYLV